MKKSRHHVTDHAVLRWLERVKGVDIEAVRREIGRVADKGITAGACGVISHGVVLRIADGVVVTVTPQHQPDRRSGRKPRRRPRHGT